uniref:JNK-interacting protein 1 (inferred by orthology to a D. melanogaster protein) n=1 Tax=Strongyloides venezuelensis TaxID=75913 RepID=A0A0K0F433_STRVS
MHNSYSLHYNQLSILNEGDGNKNCTIENEIKCKEFPYCVTSQQDYKPNKSENLHFFEEQLVGIEIEDNSDVYYQQHNKDTLKGIDKLPNTIISEFLRKFNQDRIHHLKQKNEDEMETSSDSDEDLYMHKILAPLRKSKTTPGIYNSSQVDENNIKDKKGPLFSILKSQTTFNFMEIQRNTSLKNESFENRDRKISLERKGDTDNLKKNCCDDNTSTFKSDASHSMSIKEKLEEDMYIIKEEEVCRRDEGNKIIEDEKCFEKVSEIDEIVDDSNIPKNKYYLESNSLLNNMNLHKVWSVPGNIDYFGDIYNYQNTVSVASSRWSAPELECKHNYYSINSSISSSEYNDNESLSKQSILDNKLNITNHSTYKDLDDDEDLQLTKFGDTKFFKNLDGYNVSFMKSGMVNSASDGNLKKIQENNCKNPFIEEKYNTDKKHLKESLMRFDKSHISYFPISTSMIGNFERKLNILQEVDEKFCYQNNYNHIDDFEKEDIPTENLKILNDFKMNDKNFYKSNKMAENELLVNYERQVNNDFVVRNNLDYQNLKNGSSYGSSRNLSLNDIEKLNSSISYNIENNSNTLKDVPSLHTHSSSINSISTSLRYDNINGDRNIMPHSLSSYGKNTIIPNSTLNNTSTITTSSTGGVRKRILPKRPDYIDYVSIAPEEYNHHAATTSCAMSNYRIEDDLMYKRDFALYNSGPNVNQKDGGNIYYSSQINNSRFSNSMSQQYLNSNIGQSIPGSSQGLQGNINTVVSRSHRKLPPLPIKAEVAALIEGITKPLPPSISSLMNPSNHLPQQGHSSINSTNAPGSLDYDVHIEPQMQHSPCYPYVKANTINGRNSGDHQLCYGIESTIIRSTCTIEDSYYEDGLNGNAQGSVKQVIHTNTDDSSGVSSCCTNIDNLNPTHRVQNIFIPRHDDEILLEIGDAIHVEREYDDHWCFGTNLRTGKHGIFPSAHVCEIDLVEEICMGALNSNASKPLHEDRDTFYLTMLASIEVAHHKGNDVLVQAINKVMSCYQNKEEILVPQTVLMEVSLRGIHVIDKKRKNLFRCPTFDFFFSLQNISFCGAHPKHLKYFGFITKHPLLPRFACHVFLSNQSTQPIVEAIGRAFKRSYDEYMAFAHPTEDIYIE